MDTRSPRRATKERIAYVTMLTDDSFVAGAQALFYSLNEAKSNGQWHKKAERVCIVTPQVSKITRVCLKRMKPPVRVIEVSPIPNPNADVHVEGWINSGYTKLNIWKLTEYSKIVYIDADAIVVASVDELFGLDVDFAAAPDTFPPDKFNAGVMVIKPDKELLRKMMLQIHKLPSHDGGDTGFLNSFFPGWYSMPAANRLPFKYNALRTMHWLTYGTKTGYWDSVKPLKIIHYCSSPKPWEDTKRKGELEMLWWQKYMAAQAPKGMDFGALAGLLGVSKPAASAPVSAAVGATDDPCDTINANTTNTES